MLPKTYMLKVIATALAITLTAGCTSMRPVRAVDAPSPPKQYTDIKPGDGVALKMKDGRRVRFKVQSVDGEALVSQAGERYPRAEMIELEHQQFSHAKTWSLVVGGVVFGLVVLYGIALASLYDEVWTGGS
jgi:hypothetical protein